MPWSLIVSAACVIIVAVVGARLTVLGPWYAGLRKPAWKPPDAAFGAIWTVVFILLVTAFTLAWERSDDPSVRLGIALTFAINCLLNIGWNILFFRMRRPDLALIEVVIFWFSIVAMMWAFGQSGLLPALLLIPYLAWVTAASFLNRAIVVMNPRSDASA